MVVPPEWRALGFTSGRRTYAGNRKVGGVANSAHLTGTAADFTAPVHVLRQRLGPNVKILDEKDHRHVEGLENVPYWGRNGTIGLVNGVDTSAPKGQPVRRPDPITQRLMPNYLQMSMPQNGVDPLAPQPPQQPMGVGMGMMQPTPQPEMQQPNLAAMSQPSMGRDPLAPKPKAFGKGGVGWAILGSLGDALAAYGGQRGVFAPMMQDMMQQQAEEDRFRRKLEADAAERARKAAEPPSWLTDARTFAALPEPQKAMVTAHRDALYPVLGDYVDGQGNTRKGVYSRTTGGFAGGSGPQRGQIIDDYEFLGGDPNDERNYRKVR